MKSQDERVPPRMDDLANSQASPDHPTPDSAEMPAPSPRRSVFREVPWRWSDVLLGFALYLLSYAAAVLIGPRPWFVAASRQLLVPLTLLGLVWMIVVPLWIVRTRKPHAALLPRPRAVLVEALFALLAYPVVFAASNAVSEIVAHLLAGVEARTFPWSPQAGSFNRIEWLVFVIIAVIVAPVAEETFYRGLFYNALRQRLHPILAALIQAAVFGYVHPFGIANSVGIAMAALALALVYEWRKTLLTPILLHALMNAVGIALLTWTLAAEAAAPRIGVIGEARPGGCQVTEVVPGGSAEAAGLQIGDVITAVDGEPVADILGVVRVIRKHRVGDTVSVEWLRGGMPRQADVVLVRLKQ
jgi:membrane protease YdiL (CAAX protease family)